jgi:cytochrome P450
MSVLVYVVEAAAGLAAVLFLRKLLSNRGRRYPPGPKGWSVIGNLLDMPKSHSWRVFSEMGDTYGMFMLYVRREMTDATYFQGDLIYLNVLGSPILVINSYETAIEMLDRKGLIYSNRPVLVMAGLSGYHDGTVLMPYGPRYRNSRKLMQQYMGTKALTARFSNVFEEEMRRMVRRVLHNPRSETLSQHIRKCVKIYLFSLKAALTYLTRATFML